MSDRGADDDVVQAQAGPALSAALVVPGAVTARAGGSVAVNARPLLVQTRGPAHGHERRIARRSRRHRLPPIGLHSPYPRNLPAPISTGPHTGSSNTATA